MGWCTRDFITGNLPTGGPPTLSGETRRFAAHTPIYPRDLEVKPEAVHNGAVGCRSATELRLTDLNPCFGGFGGVVERLAPDELRPGCFRCTEQCFDVVIGELVVVIARSYPSASAQIKSGVHRLGASDAPAACRFHWVPAWYGEVDVPHPRIAKLLDCAGGSIVAPIADNQHFDSLVGLTQRARKRSFHQ